LWGLERQSTNLELKPIDCSSNPYLAFGGLIAAGLDGFSPAHAAEKRERERVTLLDDGHNSDLKTEEGSSS
jgi:glutamine synthetase